MIDECSYWAIFGTIVGIFIGWFFTVIWIKKKYSLRKIKQLGGKNETTK